MSFLDIQPTWVLAALLGGMIVPQVGLTIWFIRMVRQRMRIFQADASGRDDAGKVPAEVVLCLRGCDATLMDVFTSLARQRHRDWRLRVIVDAESDPAWEVAHTAVHTLEKHGASWREARIEPLAIRPTTGSLKCASLRQAFESLDPRTCVVALIDADSVVRDDWLVTLVDESTRPGVGAVSGNRWYEPVHDTLAGTVRLLWNAGAIVQMSAFGIPWGGSLAVRREAMEACGWPDIIRTTLCEDTALAEPLARAGWLYRFAPSLIAVDTDDDVALGPLTHWIARQLLTARLHHPSWPLVAIHGMGTSAALLATLTVAAVSAARGSWTAAAIAAGAVALYEAASAVLFVVITSSVRQAVVTAGGRLRPFSLRRMCWQMAMIPVTQAVYATATIVAVTTRSIEWRGITYDVTWFAGRRGVCVRHTDRQETARAGEDPAG